MKELAKEKKGADDKETANEKKKVDATEAEKSSVPAAALLHTCGGGSGVKQEDVTREQNATGAAHQ